MNQRALIFLNGELKNQEYIRSSIRPDDYLVAVDGGLHYLRCMGMAPHLLIGDLDSVDPDDLKWVKPEKTEIIKFPEEKDETDFELALGSVLKRGFTAIRVIAALGGRFDHALGNLFLISSAELIDSDVILDDGYQEVFLINRRTEINGCIGDVVSLLPYGKAVQRVKTFGLKYPLDFETLFPDRTRGISNELLQQKAFVDLDEGVLICIHMRNGLKP
jgi:thiamine pyrophosphokinase